MPKRKKSTKIWNITEEEKILIMEQKRLAEEEMLKVKEALLAQFLENKLAKEEKMTQRNLSRVNQQWCHIMRRVKCKEMKKEIAILSQTIERIVDRKECVMKALVKDLQTAQEQYSMSLRNHLQNVDSIIARHKQRMDQLHREFQDDQATLVTEFRVEREQFTSQHHREIRQLQDTMYAMEHIFNERETSARTELQELLDELDTKNLEERQAMLVRFNAICVDLWRQIDTALKNYKESTKERKKAFEDLKYKDDRSVAEIEYQMRKIQRLSEKISQIKTKLAINTRESDENNRALKLGCEAMSVQFQDLKSYKIQLQGSERERLKRLVVLSDIPIKELKKKQNKAERLLRLAEMCRRLETEEEKVLPFYTSSLTQEEQDEAAAAEAEPPAQALTQVMYQYSSLETFWKRYNKVLLDKLAMDKEKTMLRQQNQQLRTHLKQYLDGISVNDEILSKANPLFVVNQRSNLPLNIPVNERRVQRIPSQLVTETTRIANFNN